MTSGKEIDVRVKRVSSVIVALGFCISAMVPSVAIASEPTAIDTGASESDFDADALILFFDQYGVPQDTQTELLDRLDRGEMWDSFKENTEPARVETFQQNGMNVSVETYPDGSIAVSSTSIPEGEDGYPRTPRAVYGCQVTNSNYGSYWKNCVADVNLGVVRMYFNFNYEFIRGKSAVITKYWNPSYVIIGGALNNHRFIKMSSSDVRYATDFSVAFKGFPVGWTAYMGVRVSGASASTYSN